MDSKFSTEFNSYSPESSATIREEYTLDIKRFIRLRAPIVITISLLIAIPGLVAAWFLVPLEYEVVAVLRFLANTPHVMEEGASQTSRVPYKSYLNTEKSLITGSAVISKVIQAPEIRALPEIADVKDPYTFVSDKIQVQSARDSELVTVGFRLRDKESARIMVSKIIEEYRSYTLNQESLKSEARLKTLMDARKNAQSRLSLQRESIMVAEEALGTFSTDPSSPDSADLELAEAKSRLAAAGQAVSSTQRQLTLLDVLSGRYEEDPDGPLFEIDIEAEVSSDPGVSTLNASLVDSQASLVALEQSSSEGNKELIIAKDKHETLVALLRETKRNVRGEKLNSKKATLNLKLQRDNQEVEDATVHRDEIQQVIDDNTGQSLLAAKARAELEGLKSKANETSDELRSLNNTINSIQLEDKAPARMSVASSPIVPIDPDRGQLLQVMALIVLAACGVGAGVGVVLELNDQQIRSPQDLAAIAAIPLIGVVPDAKTEQFPSSFHPSMLLADFPDSPSADQYRRVVARIAFPPDGIVEVNSCLIMSPTRGDGKTTLACNLAVALAQANRRVLVIDICPLDPSIEWCFGLEPQPGLAEILFEGVSYKRVVRNTEFSNLSVVGPGLTTDELRGKLASREMMEFLEEVEKDFDHVIIDSPPALFMAEAKFLAPVVDGVIVVVGARVSTRGMIKRCVKELNQANSSIIGFVLNKLRPTRGGYLRDNMDLFYRYAERDGNGAVEPNVPEMKSASYEDSEAGESAVVLLGQSDTDDKHSN